MSTTTNAQRGDHRHPEAAGAARTSTFGHGAAARLIRRTSVIALAGTLALASDPTSALAAQSQQVPQASASQGAGQPGEPPSGDAPSGAPGNGSSPSGNANTTSFDYSGTYSGGNNSNNWGTAGSNGATVRFTGIEQQLTGNIEADTISSVDLHLTQGSIWTGSASITNNANGATSDAPITVNVDGTSSWVVTDSCTISALNVASGAQVVDENGSTVTIVTGGQTVVQGDSDVTVTCDSYSTDYDASEAGTLSDDLIDRSDFDEQTGTSTTWSMGDQGSTTQASATQATTSTQTQAETSSETSENPIIAFFQWLGGLLGF